MSVSSAVAPSRATTAARPSNRGYVLRQAGTSLLGGLISFVLVVLAGFFLFRLLPGDPVTNMTRGREVTAQQLAQLRAEFDLDKPVPVQFFHYLTGVLTGNLGDSFELRVPVAQVIGDRLGPTLLLTGTAAVVAMLLGLPLGTRAGWRPGSVFDKLTVGVGLTFWSMPTFWFGLLLLMVFGVGIGPLPGLFPVSGMISTDAPAGPVGLVLDVAWHLVLPVITIVAVTYAQYVLVMRSSILDERGSDYLLTAQAKGLRDDLIRRRHAVPNALLPTVTIMMLHIGALVNGAVTTEYIYSWPGLGSLTADALRTPDLPVLQGTFIVFSGCVIIANVVADLLYLVLDPRLRHRS